MNVKELHARLGSILADMPAAGDVDVAFTIRGRPELFRVATMTVAPCTGDGDYPDHLDLGVGDWREADWPPPSPVLREQWEAANPF